MLVHHRLCKGLRSYRFQCLLYHLAAQLGCSCVRLFLPSSVVGGGFPLTHHVEVVLYGAEQAVQDVAHLPVAVELRIELLETGQYGLSRKNSIVEPMKEL